MNEFGLILGWGILAALCAIPVLIFLALPLGRHYKLRFPKIAAIALIIGGLWAFLILTNPGGFVPEEDCVESSPQGSGRC